MFWLWLTTLLFLAALAEIILGLYQLAVPCLLLTAFYFASLLPWQKAFLPILLAAALLDSSLGRSFPACGCAAILMLIFCHCWRKFGNWDSWLSLLLPGAALAIILTAVTLVQHKITLGSLRPNNWGQTAAQAAFAIVLLPPLCQVLEGCARRLSLRRLETSAPNFREENSGAVEKIDHE